MSKKKLSEGVRAEVETIGYDRSRLRYLGYEAGVHLRSKANKKRIRSKIIWEVISTGEIVEQRLEKFRKGQNPTGTNKEYELEVTNILKERRIDGQYSFEIFRTKQKTWVKLTRLSDGQKGYTLLKLFRNGGLPKQFAFSFWDLESFRKYFSRVQPELSKQIEILEYFLGGRRGRGSKVKVREISSGKIDTRYVRSVLAGAIPRTFNLCQHPRNDIPSKLYICLVSEYCKKQGPFITVGVTCKTTKQRYKKHLLKQILITESQLNAVTTEKIILNQIIGVLGPPDAGTEAWLHTDTNLKTIIEIFKQNIRNL
jgi:hypothetical protein